MGAGAAGVINYCYADQQVPEGEKVIRGELLYSNEIWEARLPDGRLNVASIAAQFHQVAALNEDTKKFLWHQTFSFPPGEKISNETMVKIARDFAKDFGFEDNQYLVFRHRDTPHEHFHIVANRIAPAGKNTASDQHNFERIQVFSRKMEQKYGLSIPENHRQKVDAKYNRKNSQLDQMIKTLELILPKCHSLSELSISLKKKGIVMHLGRGVAFTDKKSGVTFKGLDLGRNYSRANIEKLLGKKIPSVEQREKTGFDGYQRQALRQIIDRSLLQMVGGRHTSPGDKQQRTSETSWEEFAKHLQKEGIGLKLVRDELTGRIKGAAYQTSERRYINSRELGTHYTIKALTLRFGRSPEEFEKLLSEARNPSGKSRKELSAFAEAADFSLPEAATKVFTGSNAASETNKDLAKIAEAQRLVDPKKSRRKVH